MNPVTFNDDLSPVVFKDHRLGLGENIYIPGIKKSLLESRIFIYDDPPNEKLRSKRGRDIIEKFDDPDQLLPFSNIRIFINPNEESKSFGVKHYKLWISKTQLGLFAIYSANHDINSIPSDLRKAYNTNRPGTGIIMTSENIVSLVNYGTCWEICSKSNNRGIYDFSLEIMTSICWFFREITSPTNFIAKVEPDKKGKSVEWRESRSHYVIIDRGHPANSKSITHGATVEDDPEARRTRMAHSRRAHTRVLRSERFRRARGRKIWVKSCWVGPKEWKDAGSIYRIEHDAVDRKGSE